MKTINFNHEKTLPVNIDEDLTERQPCWYADFENSDNRNKAMWVVGLKSSEKNSELKIKLSSLGNTKDDDFWSFVSSLEFGVELIGRYRMGDKRAVDNWLATVLSK